MFCKVLKLSRLHQQYNYLNDMGCHCIEFVKKAGPTSIPKQPGDRSTCHVCFPCQNDEFRSSLSEFKGEIHLPTSCTIFRVIYKTVYLLYASLKCFFLLKSQRSQLLNKCLLSPRETLKDELFTTHGDSLFLMVYHDSQWTCF